LALVLLQTPGVQGGRLGDDTTYYLAGRAVLTGDDPYANPSFRQWPAVAAAYAALALVPPGIALRVWPLAVAAAVALGGFLAWRSVEAEATAGRHHVGAVWASLVLLSLPTHFTVYLGQMTGLCFLAYVFGRTWRERRPFWAGIAFGAMAAKPHLALIALPAVLTASPAVVAGWFVGALMWPLASLVVGGPDGLVAFARQLLHVGQGGDGLISIALVDLVPATGAARTALQAGGLVVLGALLIGLVVRQWCASRPVPPGVLDAAAAAVLALLPYALFYDMLFAAPAMLRAGTRPTLLSRSLLVACWVLPVLAVVFRHQASFALALPALLPAAAALSCWVAVRSHPSQRSRGQPDRLVTSARTIASTGA
jgi:hypothetical protein